MSAVAYSPFVGPMPKHEVQPHAWCTGHHNFDLKELRPEFEPECYLEGVCGLDAPDHIPSGSVRSYSFRATSWASCITGRR